MAPRPISRKGNPNRGNSAKPLVNELWLDRDMALVALNAVEIQNRAKPAKGMPNNEAGSAVNAARRGSAVPVQ